MKKQGSKLAKVLLLVTVFMILSCAVTAELVIFRVSDPEAFGQAAHMAGKAAQTVGDGISSTAKKAADAAVDAADYVSQQAEEVRTGIEEAVEAARQAREAERIAEAVNKANSASEAAAKAVRAARKRQEKIRQEELKKAARQKATDLYIENGREILSGGSIPLIYYNQTDPEWAEKLFGSDPIGTYGCGPTSLAIAVSSMTGKNVNPEEMAAWTASAGYCSPGNGSCYGIVYGVAKHFGLHCEALDFHDPQILCDALSQGGIVVALMGPGHFTDGGHFMLLHGVTQTGKVLVADPNSRNNSLTVWSPQLILDELSPTRLEGAPLWLLTVA